MNKTLLDAVSYDLVKMIETGGHKFTDSLESMASLFDLRCGRKPKPSEVQKVKARVIDIFIEKGFEINLIKHL